MTDTAANPARPPPPRPAGLEGIRLVAIAAMSENRVIGLNNRLPWHIPAEFAWFRRATSGKVLLMGRRTFESLGRPLPHRHHLVLTRHPPEPASSVQFVAGLGEAGAAARAQGASEIWICGGSRIYELTLPWWDEAWITTVKRSVEGDAFLPAFEHLFPPPETSFDCPDFLIRHFHN